MKDGGHFRMVNLIPIPQSGLLEQTARAHAPVGVSESLPTLADD